MWSLRRKIWANPWVKVGYALFALFAAFMALTNEPTCDSIKMQPGDVCSTKTYEQKDQEQQRIGLLVAVTGALSLGFGLNTFRKRAQTTRQLVAANLAARAAVGQHAAAGQGYASPPNTAPPGYAPQATAPPPPRGMVPQGMAPAPAYAPQPSSQPLVAAPPSSAAPVPEPASSRPPPLQWGPPPT